MDLKRLQIDRSSAAPRRPGTQRGFRWGMPLLLLLLGALGWLFHRPIMQRVDRLRFPTVDLVRVSETTALAASAVSGTAANGYIVARVRAALSADTPGRVVELNVSEGSVLKRGEVVARLFSEELEAGLRAAEAELESGQASVASADARRQVAAADVLRSSSQLETTRAQLTEAQSAAELAALNFARITELVDSQVESAQRLDEARAESKRSAASVAAAEAAVATASAGVELSRVQESAEGVALAEAQSRLGVLSARRDQAMATLDKSIVRAPFDGIVVLKDAEVGEVVSPNAQGSQSRGSVATMVDFSTLEVQVELPEVSLAQVRLEQPATIFLDAFPGQAYTGTVERIWPTANRQKATVELRVSIDAPDDKLRPDMGARVVFQGDERRAAETSEVPSEGSILVPASSVVRTADGDVVFVYEQGLARSQAVLTGDERTGRVLIEEGLRDGDRILREPPLDLADGDRVFVSDE